MIPDFVKEKYKAAIALDLQEAEKLVLQTCSEACLGSVFIIIDALDECNESEHRRPVLGFIQRLREIQRVRVFATSRYYPGDIHHAFCTDPRIAVKANQSDLTKYIAHELQGSDRGGLIDDVLATKIAESLLREAHGM